jgi:hypothetical protein
MRSAVLALNGAYSTNYLIDFDHVVVMDMKASTAVRQAEVTSAKRMINGPGAVWRLRPAALMLPERPSSQGPAVHSRGARDLARDIAATNAYVTSRRRRKKVEMLFAHLQTRPEARPTAPLAAMYGVGSAICLAGRAHLHTPGRLVMSRGLLKWRG